MRNVCRLVVCGALALVAACGVEDESVVSEPAPALGIQEVGAFESELVAVDTRALSQVPVGAAGVTMTTLGVVIDGACGVGRKCVTVQLTNNTMNDLRGLTVVLTAVSPVSGLAIDDDILPVYLWRGGYPEDKGVWLYGNLEPGQSVSRVWVLPNVPVHTGVTGKFLADVVPDASPIETACSDRANSDGDQFYDCMDADCSSNAACPTYPVDCQDWQSYGYNGRSGLYPIDPDGNGSVAKFTAYCDLKTQGGGWTLIMSAGNVNTATSSSNVTGGSQRYLPSLTMRAVANTSTQVMIRSNGDLARYAISNPNVTPIFNFRAGNAAYTNDAADESSQWTGPMKDANAMWITCSPGGTVYPNIYHACNNEGGLHWTGTLSRWIYNSGMDETLNLYFR